MGAVNAPTIRRSQSCKRSQQSVSISQSRFFRHGIDAEGNVIIRRQLKRRYVLAFFQKLPPCLVGIEACATSHHWSRELKALGHTVRLMPPAYVKPYVKRQKNDAADAEGPSAKQSPGPTCGLSRPRRPSDPMSRAFSASRSSLPTSSKPSSMAASRPT